MVVGVVAGNNGGRKKDQQPNLQGARQPPFTGISPQPDFEEGGGGTGALGGQGRLATARGPLLSSECVLAEHEEGRRAGRQQARPDGTMRLCFLLSSLSRPCPKLSQLNPGPNNPTGPRAVSLAGCRDGWPPTPVPSPSPASCGSMAAGVKGRSRGIHKG